MVRGHYKASDCHSTILGFALSSAVNNNFKKKITSTVEMIIYGIFDNRYRQLIWHVLWTLNLWQNKVFYSIFHDLVLQKWEETMLHQSIE
jgi:hypothetical protein